MQKILTLPQRGRSSDISVITSRSIVHYIISTTQHQMTPNLPDTSYTVSSIIHSPQIHSIIDIQIQEQVNSQIIYNYPDFHMRVWKRIQVTMTSLPTYLPKNYPIHPLTPSLWNETNRRSVTSPFSQLHPSPFLSVPAFAPSFFPLFNFIQETLNWSQPSLHHCVVCSTQSNPMSAIHVVFANSTFKLVEYDLGNADYHITHCNTPELLPPFSEPKSATALSWSSKPKSASAPTSSPSKINHLSSFHRLFLRPQGQATNASSSSSSSFLRRSALRAGTRRRRREVGSVWTTRDVAP